MNVRDVLDVLVIGAGPAGLATAIAATRNGLTCQIVEKGALVNSLLHYPTEMVFFTTPELMEIGGMPFVSPYDKPTRLEALRYYRREEDHLDRKSTRLNSSHSQISYAVFCLKKKKVNR